MSAYAMFPGGSLPILSKKPVVPINDPKRSDLVTKPSSPKSAVLLGNPVPQMSPSPSFKKSDNASCNKQQSAVPNKDRLNDFDNSSLNDLGIAVTSANLDRKRFIAMNGASSRIKQAGSVENWEAMEYELSINCNGKKYTVFRSLPRIVRLRNELLKEIRTRRINYPGHFGVIRSFMTHPIDSKYHVDDTDSDSDDSVIPELPARFCKEETIDGASSTGSGWRSLNNIQSSATDDCPRLEEWLKSVAKLVNPHTSPSLSDFLAEPLPKEEFMPRLFPRARRFLRRRQNQRRRSFGNLSSISEDDVIETDEIAQIEIDYDIKESLSQEYDDDDSFSECDAYDYQ